MRDQIRAAQRDSEPGTPVLLDDSLSLVVSRPRSWLDRVLGRG